MGNTNFSYNLEKYKFSIFSNSTKRLIVKGTQDMKLQNLAVIFIIIIMPIIIVFNEYMNNQINIVNTEVLYDERLLNSTYDAVKAFQLNTINTTYYFPDDRVKNMNATVDTFFNSLTTAFKYEGSRASNMKEYVPAVVLTLYDGYYIYSPFENKLTNLSQEVDVEDDYERNSTIHGLKPFVSYTCKYNYNNKKYYITYSLDNYILVDIYDENGVHSSKEGYLIDGIDQSSDKTKYTYCGVEYSKDSTEALSEYIHIADNDNDPNNDIDGRYYYTVDDGTKYYFIGKTEDYFRTDRGFDDNDQIIYINNDAQPVKVAKANENFDEFDKYFNKIFFNDSAYNYYKDAWEFTNWVKGELSGLKIENIQKDNSSYSNYKFQKVDQIFDFNSSNDDNKHIEYSNSNFNRHRADVIRAIISSNLQSAITGFGKYSKLQNVEFLMPKITESDWELLENNVCMATFFQGLRFGGKTYNNYAVVPNNFNKEYVDENDIYILKNDDTYARANDTTLTNGNVRVKKNNNNDEDFKQGILKINFERRKFSPDSYYNPISIDKNNPYYGSYTSISGTTNISSIQNTDMYRYMRELKDKGGYSDLIRTYFTALGRERYGSFKYTTNYKSSFVKDIENLNGPGRAYAIALDLGGGIINPNNIDPNIIYDSNESKITYYTNREDGEPFVLPEPEKEGYDFVGWLKDGNEPATKHVEIPADSRGDLNYTAKWKVHEYTINYLLNDGTINGTNPSKYTIESNNITLINPTKTNYNFTGWTGTGLSGRTTNVTIPKGSTGDRTYTANWDARTYTVEYYNGNTKVGSSSHKYNEASNLSTFSNMTLTGFTFNGWTTATDSLTRMYTNGQSVINLADADKTVTLYAIWQRNATFYSGTNGSTTATQYYNSKGGNYSVTLPSTITAVTGWTALGWRNDTTAGGKEYDSGANVTESEATYYAVYSRTLTISYNGNSNTGGTTASQTRTQYFNSSGSTSNTTGNLATNGFARTNYIFSQWADGSTTGTKYNAGTAYSWNPGVTTTASKTFYAVWTAANYAVSSPVTYTLTLADAVSKANAGATITVLNDITDTTTATISKNLTLNTNGKTLTRNDRILVSGGTLTVNGNGAIYCSNKGTASLWAQGGNLTISDSPNIKGEGYALVFWTNTTGELNINGGYYSSIARETMVLNGGKKATIKNANIYTTSKYKDNLWVDKIATIEIDNSNLGCGTENYESTDTNDDALAIPIHYAGASTCSSLNINNSKLMAGTYGEYGIWSHNNITRTISLTGSTSIYAVNKACIHIYKGAATVIFNSSGEFFTGAKYVAIAEDGEQQGTANFTVTKGKFVSRENRYMFWSLGSAIKTYQAGTTKSTKAFKYMNWNWTISSTNLANCYSYNK